MITKLHDEHVNNAEMQFLVIEIVGNLNWHTVKFFGDSYQHFDGMLSVYDSLLQMKRSFF